MSSNVYTEDGLKNINGTELYYKIIGQGEPILIIHGGPGLNHKYLLHHLQPLAKKYQLIFYDQRACGKSSLDVNPDSITIDSFIQDIDDLRKVFGIDRLNLMAHSWGGLLAMKYAIKYPEFTNSLILLNSVGASSAINAKANQLLLARFTPEDSLQRQEIIQTEEFQRRETTAIESLMKITFKHQFYNPALIDSLKLSLNKDYAKTAQLLQYLGKDITSYDFHAELNKIEASTLMIYGDHDPSGDFAGQSIQAAITNSKLLIINECGHFPFIEKQDEFNEIVMPFIDENI